MILHLVKHHTTHIGIHLELNLMYYFIDHSFVSVMREHGNWSIVKSKACCLTGFVFFFSSSVNSWLFKMTSALGEKRRTWWECPESQVRTSSRLCKVDFLNKFASHKASLSQRRRDYQAVTSIITVLAVMIQNSKVVFDQNHLVPVVPATSSRN